MIIRRIFSITVLTFTVGVLAPAAQPQTAQSPITGQDLLQGLKNPSRWLTFSGDYSGQRHSPLQQLTPQNVAGLVPQLDLSDGCAGPPRARDREHAAGRRRHS